MACLPVVSGSVRLAGVSGPHPTQVNAGGPAAQ